MEVRGGGVPGAPAIEGGRVREWSFVAGTLGKKASTGRCFSSGATRLLRGTPANSEESGSLLHKTRKK